MLKYVILMLLPAVALSCDMMNQLNAKAHVTYGRMNSSGAEEMLDIVQSFSLDVQQGMIYVDQNITTEKMNTFNQKGYFNYKTKLQYFRNDAGCVKDTIHDKAIWEVLKNSPALAHSYIGAGSNKESVTMYGFDDGTSSYYVTATDADCVPVAMKVTGPVTGGGRYSMTVQIFGVEKGVPDASVFALPKNCAS